MAGRVRVCRSFFSRFLGLMLRRRLGPEQGALLVMTTTSRIDSAIHMLFVFFPLAIFWLDEEGGSFPDASYGRGAPSTCHNTPRATSSNCLPPDGILPWKETAWLEAAGTAG
jgi:hypothetical protein